MAVTVDVDPEHAAQPASNLSVGITAAELLSLGGIRYGAPSRGELERWLLDAGFGERNGGPDRLVPTELGLEVAALGAPLA